MAQTRKGFETAKLARMSLVQDLRFRVYLYSTGIFGNTGRGLGFGARESGKGWWRAIVGAVMIAVALIHVIVVS